MIKGDFTYCINLSQFNRDIRILQEDHHGKGYTNHHDEIRRLAPECNSYRELGVMQGATSAQAAVVGILDQQLIDIDDYQWTPYKKLWDNMKGAFEGGTAAQKLDNVYDYGVALIMDPLNLVTFGAGKLLAGGATKAVATVAEEGLKIATNKILKKAGKQGVKVADLTPAIKAEIDQARRRVLAKAMNREAVEGVEEGAVGEALKTVANKELARGATVETLGMITIDSIQQKAAYMKVGFQEEFNVLNTALIAGGGFFGYGLAKTIPHLTGSKLPTSVALDVFDAAQGAEAAAKTLARTESKKEAKQKLDEIMADDTQRTAFVNDLRKSTIAAEDWAKTVMEGRQISATLSDENLEAIATQTDEAFKAFRFKLGNVYFPCRLRRRWRRIFYSGGYQCACNHYNGGYNR